MRPILTVFSEGEEGDMGHRLYDSGRVGMCVGDMMAASRAAVRTHVAGTVALRDADARLAAAQADLASAKARLAVTQTRLAARKARLGIR